MWHIPGSALVFGCAHMDFCGSNYPEAGQAECQQEEAAEGGTLL